MGVGREAGGGLVPQDLDLVSFSKKVFFLSFQWEKPNFTIFGTPWKNPLVAPLGKILLTPMVVNICHQCSNAPQTHVKRTAFGARCSLIATTFYNHPNTSWALYNHFNTSSPLAALRSFWFNNKICCGRFIKTLLLSPHCCQHLYWQLNVGKILNMLKICPHSSAVFMFSSYNSVSGNFENLIVLVKLAKMAIHILGGHVHFFQHLSS